METKYEVDGNQLKVINVTQTEEIFSLPSLLEEKSRLQADITYFTNKMEEVDAKINKAKELGIVEPVQAEEVQE